MTGAFICVDAFIGYANFNLSESESIADIHKTRFTLRNSMSFHVLISGDVKQKDII